MFWRALRDEGSRWDRLRAAAAAEGFAVIPDEV